LPIYGDGQQIRDWLHVEDHCQALVAVLQRGKLGETYNIGGGNQPTNLEIVQTICQIMDEVRPDSPHQPHEHLIEFVDDRPAHDRRYAMNIEKIQTALGWKPLANLKDGLRDAVVWYLEHPDWVQAIRKRPTYQQWLNDNYGMRGTHS
jgi:dTDP-glucose 4,6-dehydratase